MKLTYLDHVSATPLHPEVKKAIVDYIDKDGFGNPMGQHRVGDQALEMLESAR